MTGARQRVGNYAGVTVEKKEGDLTFHGHRIRVIDLPGTYSLSATSLEEIIARNYILHDRPDVVINILDGSNLERNLYLTLQLIEMGVPIVAALNMSDELAHKGVHVDYKEFADRLSCPVIPTVGHRGKGIHPLLHAAIDRIAQPSRISRSNLDYGPEIADEIATLSSHIAPDSGSPSPQWQALKLLEHDADIADSLANHDGLFHALDQSRMRLRERFNEEPEMVIAEKRYKLAAELYRGVARSTQEFSVSYTEKIDKVLTNRIIGLPIFAIAMYVTFWVVFSVGAYPMDWLASGADWLGTHVAALWPAASQSPLKSLLVNGIIGGVGGVLVFLPNILLLFLALGILEYTGYMARAAFLVDRLMRWAGLHGKSFIPMITGFGCTVPAIMATRCLDNQRDRLITILVLPLISCGARFPIYALLIPAFFAPNQAATVLFILYVTGILLAVSLAKILRLTVFKGVPSPFVLELPPYRIPTAKTLALYMWERGRLYAKKAGTLILGVSILLWALGQFPQKMHFNRDYAQEAGRLNTQYAAGALDRSTYEREVGQLDNQKKLESLQYSFMGRIGGSLEKVFRPAGFDWKISSSLVGALAAKEVFVAQLGIVYSLGATSGHDSEASKKLGNRMRSEVYPPGHPKAGQHVVTPLIAFAILLFCLIAAPCTATTIMTVRETGSWKWGAVQFFGLTILGWIVAVLVYQVGLAVGL